MERARAAPAAGSSGRRPGRPPGHADTRGEGLAAGCSRLAGRGYERATVRGIARSAGVDPALVHHYFGSKERLFVAALQLPLTPSDVVPGIVEGDPDRIGERLVRTFLTLWGNPATRAPLVAILRTAMSHERAAAMLRGFISSTVLARLAERLDLPDARLRVELAASHLVGLGLARYVLKVEPLASASEDEVVALVAPAVQAYLTAR